MRKKDFRYIYGPVSSWRLGISLGIDLLSSAEKICNFDCIYCQLGPTLSFVQNPEIYIETSEIIKELKSLAGIKVDYVTFSGRGEPCLAKNLGEATRAIKKLNLAPVAVLTNAALIGQAKIRENLSYADFVIAKLDAYSQESLEEINHPARTIRFDKILQGLKQFKKYFKGKFALQIMFVPENQNDALSLAEIAGDIQPDEVQINTSRRPCPKKPLSKDEIARIKEYFAGLNFISVYDTQPKKVVAFSKPHTLSSRARL